VPAAQLDGAWLFVKYLTDGESQATWAAATGSVPVRRSAATSSAVTRSWDAVPGYRVAYEQIASSPGNAASSMPLIGAAPSVDAAVQAALQGLASGGNAQSELRRAVAVGNAAMSDYDKRF
jgi:ABC-type glycerol-3-phosphate transport system substrate-binding protein